MKPKYFSLGLLAIGIFLLVQVVMPVVAFNFWELISLDQNSLLVDPKPDSGSVLGVAVEQSGNFSYFVSSNNRTYAPTYTQFNLTIPKINLTNLNVMVDSNTFEKALGQLPGSALPGERGNVFITGHSSLEFLYSPTNYLAIFTHLPEIKKGDQIYADVLGQRFDYQVIGLKVVDPKETGVINPPDSEGRYLTLMTCVPPGIFNKRLIVLAELK